MKEVVTGLSNLKSKKMLFDPIVAEHSWHRNHQIDNKIKQTLDRSKHSFVKMFDE